MSQALDANGDAPMKRKPVTTNMQFEADIYAEGKAFCALDGGRSFRSLVHDALREYLKNNKPKYMPRQELENAG